MDASSAPTRSLKGLLLLAGADMLDPNFAQTVTLLIEDNEDGALGLVLNRPTDITVASAWAEVGEGDCLHEGVLHQGGPCPGPMMLLHSDPARGQDAVTQGVHFTSDKDHITSLINDPPGSLRAFIGYAGWGAGQLLDELQREAWIVTAAPPEAVFGQTDNLWFDLLRRVSPTQAAILRNPALWPTDPSTN